MNAGIFFAEGFLFMVCLGIHAGLWRFSRPRNAGTALLGVFLLPWAAGMLIATFFLKDVFSAGDIFSVALLHLAWSCAYIQTYPAIEGGFSPTLLILLQIEKSPQGLTEPSLVHSFDEKSILREKVDDLISSGLVCNTQGQLVLTGKGRIFVRPFILLRRLLGLKAGRG